MKKNRLIIASGVLVALLVTLYATSREPKPEEFRSPFHKIKMEDVTTLEIRRPADSASTVMRKDGENWQVVEPIEAAADSRTVQNALEKIRDFEVVDVASESRDSYANLEVDDAHAVHVIAKKGGTVLLDVFLGAFKGNFTMVRRPDDDRVYRATGSIRFNFDKALKDWRDRVIFDLDAEKIARVEFHSSNGHFKFNRGEGTWIVDGPEIPEFDFHKVSSIVTTLAKLRTTDFADRVTTEQAGLGESASTVRFQMKDDPTEIVLRIGNSVTEGSQEMFYAQREGNPLIFLISKYLANRLRPDEAKLKGRPRGDGGPAAGPGMPGMPGMPGAPPSAAAGPGGAGNGQIPPEIMEQLQRQMRQNRSMSGSLEN